MFGGRGGILAPDLTQIRSRYRSRSTSRRDVRAMALIEANTSSGSTVRGVKKGEDTFTLQLMDEQRRWHFLNKRDVRITNT